MIAPVNNVPVLVKRFQDPEPWRGTTVAQIFQDTYDHDGKPDGYSDLLGIVVRTEKGHEVVAQPSQMEVVDDTP